MLLLLIFTNTWVSKCTVPQVKALYLFSINYVTIVSISKYNIFMCMFANKVQAYVTHPLSEVPSLFSLLVN